MGDLELASMCAVLPVIPALFNPSAHSISSSSNPMLTTQEKFTHHPMPPKLRIRMQYTIRRRVIPRRIHSIRTSLVKGRLFHASAHTIHSLSLSCPYWKPHIPRLTMRNRDHLEYLVCECGSAMFRSFPKTWGRSRYRYQ